MATKNFANNKSPPKSFFLSKSIETLIKHADPTFLIFNSLFALNPSLYILSTLIPSLQSPQSHTFLLSSSFTINKLSLFPSLYIYIYITNLNCYFSPQIQCCFSHSSSSSDPLANHKKQFSIFFREKK